MPDAQMLFLEKRDCAICAIGKVRAALIEREDILALMKARPAIGFAVWRGTLIDAAIVRAAVGKQFSSQPAQMRMAHLFCDLYYRARSAGVAAQGSYRLPLHQGQLADALAMSLVTVNRTLQKIRRTGALHFRQGLMTVADWPRLADIGQFDPSYLHIRRTVRP
jgi:CRP-like cAMP-binding protein